LKRGSLLAYLIHMTLRIVEIHRVLKPTGSFYLHCDPTASHYLKLVLDAVFCGQGGQYLNEIIWAYNVGGKSKKWFARKHDVIFWYGKGKEHFFDGTLAGLERETGTKSFGGKMGVDEDGRRYQDKLVKSSGKYYRYYLDDPKIPEDWWVDINSLQSQDAERMGYPTQKPEALLERIIKTGSPENGVILDAYCGCGTTVAVAQRLGRQWIGIDITYQSIALILKRLEDKYAADWPAVEANILLDGVPRDLASAVALANRKDDKTRKEFEKWMILTYSRNQARINEKKGADGGVDGIAYFLKDTTKIGGAENGKAIFQVKSGKTGRGDLAKLNSDRIREKADFGILLCMDMPTKAMRDEIAAAGKYQHPLLNREDDRLQVVTVAEIFAPHNKRLDLPMARADAVKSAAAVGDSDKQERLL
jgi:SAM-dependent methyltransferase